MIRRDLIKLDLIKGNIVVDKANAKAVHGVFLELPDAELQVDQQQDAQGNWLFVLRSATPGRIITASIEEAKPD